MRRTSKCNGCQAEIEWVTTAANGKPMPLDLEPNPNGNVEIGPDGRAIVHNQEPMMPYVHRQSHWATCPNAGDFKR